MNIPRYPGLLDYYLAILGLSCFAFALPILDTLGRGATFFVAHGAESTDIVLFAVAVYLLPGALIFLPVAVARGLGQPLSQWLGNALIGGVGCLWLLGLLSDASPWLSISIALAGGGAVAYLYSEKGWARGFLRTLGIISPLAPIVFLLLSPASKLIYGGAGVDSAKVTGKSTPVVFLVFDELSQAVISLPDGGLDRKRLPNFARLADISTWYSNTTTVSSKTDKAVPAILAGKRVEQGTPPVHSQYPQNIFTLLGASHRVYALESGTLLCPQVLCRQDRVFETETLNRRRLYADAWIVWLHTVFPAAWAERRLPGIAGAWRDFHLQRDGAPSAREDSTFLPALVGAMSVDRRKRVEDFNTSLAGAQGATLHYLHLLLPHIPWIFLPDGTSYNGMFAPGQSMRRYDWHDDQYLVDQGILRYALQVEYTDRLLGQILDSLESSGRLDETLLIVVSDHGLAFEPGLERRRPEPTTLADVARVPLFIKYPLQRRAEEDTRPIETIDIMATAADVLELPLTGSHDGQSLISEDWQVRERRLLEAGERVPDFEKALELQTAIARIHRVVKPGRSALAAIPRGERVDLPGCAEDSPLPGSTLRLQLDRPKWLRSVDPGSGFLPARLTGHLVGATVGAELLVELNGDVAGAGRTYNDRGAFSILLDPGKFRRGLNQVCAYELDGEVIRRIPNADEPGHWLLHWDQKGELVSISTGTATWRPGTGLNGHLALPPPFFSRPVSSLRGWVYDEQSGAAATLLLLLKAGAVESIGFRRYAVHEEMIKSGFNENAEFGFSITLDHDLRKQQGQLSVVALFDNGAFLHLLPASASQPASGIPAASQRPKVPAVKPR